MTAKSKNTGIIVAGESGFDDRTLFQYCSAFRAPMLWTKYMDDRSYDLAPINTWVCPSSTSSFSLHILTRAPPTIYHDKQHIMKLSLLVAGSAAIGFAYGALIPSTDASKECIVKNNTMVDNQFFQLEQEWQRLPVRDGSQV